MRIKFFKMYGWIKMCDVESDVGKDTIKILIDLSGMEFDNIKDAPHISGYNIGDKMELIFTYGLSSIEMREGSHFELFTTRKVEMIAEDKFKIDPKTDDEFCNGCRFLSIGEDVQDEIFKLRGKKPDHYCNLYLSRVYHEAVKMPHPQHIYRCSRCKKDGNDIYTRIKKGE